MLLFTAPMNSDDRPTTQSFYVMKPQTDSCATHDLTILYMNIRSAVNKWTELEALIAHLHIHPDVIVLVETWLKDDE